MNISEKLNQKLDLAAKKKMVQIAARGFFDELVDYGFDDGDIINFTTEILDLLLKKDKSYRPRPASGTRSYPVDYRLDSSGKVLEILGPQLLLKPLGRDDAPILQSWRDGDSYRGTLIERVLDPGVDEVFRHFDSERDRFFIVRLQDGAPIGFMTYLLDWSDPSRAEMQKFLADPKHRGRGYGIQMTYLWLHYGFTRLNLRKISAKTANSNLVNINLNRKLGFRFEGHLREEVRLRDAFVDVILMSVLREQAKDLFEAPAALTSGEPTGMVADVDEFSPCKPSQKIRGA